MAIADFTAAIALNPHDAQAYRNRGLAYCRQEDYDQAIADYTAAIALNPQDALAYHNRGVSHGVMGNGEQAAADLERARELGFEV